MAATTTMENIRERRPDIAAAYDSILSNMTGPMDDYAAVVRQVMSSYGDADAAKSSVGVDVTSVSAGGIDARYFLPHGAQTDRRILYIHGGAWVGGGLDAYHGLAATLAKQANAPLLLVDYRLAPENPYPAGLDDCLAAWNWMAANGPSGPGSADHLYVAGDSAGGNIGTALTIRLIQSGQRPPARLALIAAVLDVEPNDYVARHDPFGGNAATGGSLSLYAPAPTAGSDPQVNPMCASGDILAGFPPTLLQASTDEFLMGCSIAFGQRLMREGVRTVISAWPDVPHVWHQFLESLPEATAGLAEVADFLNPRP